MIAKDEIIIRKSILHVLDTARGECILSGSLLDPGPDLYEFIRTHIHRVFVSDDAKDCEFNPETSPIYSILETWDEGEEESFIATSQAIANKLYISMGECLDVPSADLLFVSFQAESVIYLALLKLNYRESYTHDISSQEQTDIVLTRSLLPSAAMRLPEAVIINLTDYHIRLVEKRFEANGEKINYLSEKFLVCNTQLPPKKKLNILSKVITDISNAFDGADLESKMRKKSALRQEYADHKVFDVEEIGTRLYHDHPAKKNEYDEQMEKYNLQFDRFTVNNERTAKKLERQVLVTDTGIEISIPMDTYNKPGNFEVKTDPSGKTTIVISNISDVTLK